MTYRILNCKIQNDTRKLYIIIQHDAEVYDVLSWKYSTITKSYLFIISGNALSAYILAGKSMRNSFNLLLIALAMIDNTYLFSSILESCRKRFDLQTDLHLILLPYFLYPLHSMAMTGRLRLRLVFVIRHLTPNT